MHELPDSNHHFFFAAIDVDSVFDRIPAIKDAWKDGKLSAIAGATAASGPFRQLIREVSASRVYRSIGIRGTLDLLLIEVSRLFLQNSGISSGPGTEIPFTHPAVARAKELLLEHPTRNWRVADLARLAGASPGHLAELFTRDVGVPPHEFLVRQRVELACYQLANSDAPITQIAIELGFSSSQHFATAFHKITGCTPREYRKTQRVPSGSRSNSM